MQREIKIILVKFFIITGLLIIYAVLMVAYIVPVAIHNAFGQFDQGQSQFNSGNQYQQPNQFDQGQFNNQYQQSPYQQYGTPSYNQYPQSYGMYGQPPPQYGQQNGGFSIQQIIGYILAAGSGAAGGKVAADRRTKSLEELHRETMEAELKTKTQLAELARVSYSKMPDGGSSITDAPNVQLENLKDDIDQFREKTAKA